MSQAESFLSHGLLKGFAGETTFQSTQRAGFELQCSHLVENGNTYHDEWAADRTGGGQELVSVDGDTFTRVYAGGTISVTAMEHLGITKDTIMEFLIISLNTASGNTRLSQNYGPVQHGDWTYQYQVLEQNPAIPLTTGKEDILYKDQVVFTHVFVMCPVEWSEEEIRIPRQCLDLSRESRMAFSHCSAGYCYGH